jgi:hypothetical protein
VDIYRKVAPRLRALAAHGVTLPSQPLDALPGFADLVRGLAATAAQNGLEIVSCAEELDLTRFGVLPGKCIDDALLARVFGLHLDLKKDPGQRDACGCVASRDIGMYDSCTFGCQYCYATSSFARAAANHAGHDPLAPSLL